MAVGKQHRCNRCGHKWFSRILGLPVLCPACKSPYWNKKRVRKLKRLLKKLTP